MLVPVMREDGKLFDTLFTLLYECLYFCWDLSHHFFMH